MSTRDMLTPCLRATESVLQTWANIKADPVRHRQFMEEYPTMAVELADLSEIWGES